MNLLAINWSQVGLQAGYLILSLSILVILHEFGHYITAKWFKCRVEKFYLFFDPWFSIFKKKIGETVYGIGWLPLGGYVKIAGMVDESMDKEAMRQPPQPWEFRSKPAWQRLIIMLAGVIMNILFAFFLYAMILFTWGETKLPVKNATNGIWLVDSLFKNLGLKNGDKIITVDGDSVKYFNDIQLKLLIGGRKVELERDGQKMELALPVDVIDRLIKQKGKTRELVLPRVPIILGGFDNEKTSNAKKAGLEVYDRIVGIDSMTVQYFDEIAPVLQTKKGDSIDVKFIRNERPMQARAFVDSNGMLGFRILNVNQFDSMGILKHEATRYSFLASFPAGVRKAGDKLNSYIQQFKLILNPETGAAKGLGGFKAMASIFPKDAWDWEIFWNITAFFSIVLAFMNLLPIPALDGGHVLFTLIEMITGRKPSDKFLEYAQVVGMIFLFGLMLYANWNDWFGWGKDK